MAFPSSPTDGQVYNLYIYNSSIGAWEEAVPAPHNVGEVFTHAATSAPAGALECNGAAVSRTVYSELFNAIGTIWGSGDGSTTFDLPDMRGAFARGTGSHGTNTEASGTPFTGPAVGSYENDQMQKHQHILTVKTVDAGNPAADEYFRDGKVSKGTFGNQAFWYTRPNNYYADGAGTVRTGGETQPFNAGVLWCIQASGYLN